MGIQAPLTVWAQTERMRLIPEAVRGRIFALLRTVMQAGPAVGGIVGSFVVETGIGNDADVDWAEH